MATIQTIVNKYQIVLFPNNFIVDDLLDLTNKIKNAVSKFDGINTPLPIPKEAPPEIPRIALRSKENKFNCDISFEKIDIFWNNTSEIVDYQVSAKEMVTDINAIINSIQNIQSFKRVGYIYEFFYRTPNKELEFPKSVLGNNSELENIVTFSTNFTLEKQEIGTNKNCNEVVTISTGTTNKDKDKVIILNNDLNTHQNDKLELKLYDIGNFIAEAEKLSNKDILLQKFILHDG